MLTFRLTGVQQTSGWMLEEAQKTQKQPILNRCEASMLTATYANHFRTHNQTQSF